LFSTSSRLLLMGSWIMGSVGEWDQINPIWLIPIHLMYI
jgi:hypothetical protein